MFQFWISQSCRVCGVRVDEFRVQEFCFWYSLVFIFINSIIQVSGISEAYFSCKLKNVCITPSTWCFDRIDWITVGPKVWYFEGESWYQIWTPSTKSLPSTYLHLRNEKVIKSGEWHSHSPVNWILRMENERINVFLVFQFSFLIGTNVPNIDSTHMQSSHLII